jgi:di/tricarboxylate transporter
MALTHEMITLFIILVMMILLLRETFRSDVVALFVMVTLGVTGVVGIDQLFSGFSSSIVITIIAVAIISEALSLTGLSNRIMGWLIKMCGDDERRTQAIILAVSALSSQILNPIIAAGILMPAVMGLSRRSRFSPSLLLLPLAFGVTIGGSAAFLSSWNVVANETLLNAGELSFRFTDFLLVGLPLVLWSTYIFYRWGGRLLKPDRESQPASESLRLDLIDLYRLKENLGHATILPQSPLANRTIREADWANRTGLSIVGIIRSGQLTLAPASQTELFAGDILMVQGEPDPEQLSELGLAIEPGLPENADLKNQTATLAEVVLAPHATAVGKTVQEANFREKYGLNVLGIWREGKPILENVGTTPLNFGDALLVHGRPDRLKALPAERDWIVMNEDPDVPLRPGKRWLTLGITALALLLAIANILPIHLAVMIGAVLMLFTRTLSVNEAYQAIDWRVIFQVSGMWSLSLAIQSSGLADTVIQTFFPQGTTLPPILILGILGVITTLLTQFIGAPVSVLLLAPFALTTARTVGFNPQAAVMMIALSASLTFLTPFASPVNVMVMSPGDYTARDFIKLGVPTILGGMVIILLGVQIFWLWLR